MLEGGPPTLQAACHCVGAGLRFPPMEMAPPFRDNPPTSGVPCSFQLASCTIWEMGQNPSGPPGREPPERLHLLTQLPPSGGGIGSSRPEGLLSSIRTYGAEVGQHMGSLGLCDAKKKRVWGFPFSVQLLVKVNQ